MTSYINKKFSDVFKNMDAKAVEKGLSNAVDMLKNGDPEVIAKKIGKVDKKDLMNKLNELDKDKLKDLNIDLNDIKNKITQQDLDQLAKILGQDGDKIVRKINELMK